MRHWRKRRLHHQLFAWLALTIVATVVLSAFVLHLLEPVRAPFNVMMGQVGEFAARQFAARWEDERAREVLARDVAQTFGLDLTLAGADGGVLFSSGAEPCRGPNYGFDVVQGSARLGRVEACWHGAQRFRFAIGLTILCSACLVLWIAAALLARWMTRPLSLLIETTREIGSGNLGARVRLGRHQRGELGLLAESVNDMARRIERQIKDQKELLAAVSHEVRSPLARLRLCAEILRNDSNNAQALDSIELEVVELDGLVGQLLASSRLDFETLNKQQVALGALFRQVLARHQLSETLLDDRSAGAAVPVDPTLIARALDNVLDNAVRHGGTVAGCVLRASSDAPDGKLVFEVQDSGSGFAADVLPKAFEAFYRGPGAPRSAQGSLGLGLALVRRIARAHGGDAWAENVPSGGALVAFSISRSAVE